MNAILIRCGDLFRASTRWTLVALAVLTMVDSGKATTIGIDLGPPRLITEGIDPHNNNLMIAVPFSAINGTSLTGQSVSIDVLFSDGEFIRVFSASQLLLFNIHIATTATENPGFLGDGSMGHLLNADGSVIASGGLARGSTSSGGMDGGLFSDIHSRPYDVYGVRFDLDLPVNPSIEVTDASFVVCSDLPPLFGVGPGLPPDIIPGVPDSGRSWALLLLAAAGLATMRYILGADPP